jgi:hypothetical protein
VTERHREDAFEQGVMVDVGPGAGAIVIYTGGHLAGQEIEISPLGDDSRRVHTDVLRRRTGTGVVFAAVFGSLAEGRYRLWHESRSDPYEVGVVAGEVTEIDWR